nr:hypothetical protein [uncultured Cohaesibacter sp.]
MKISQNELQNTFFKQRINMMSFKDLTTRAAEAEKTKETDAKLKDTKVIPISVGPKKAAQEQQKPKG